MSLDNPELTEEHLPALIPPLRRLTSEYARNLFPNLTGFIREHIGVNSHCDSSMWDAVWAFEELSKFPEIQDYVKFWDKLRKQGRTNPDGTFNLGMLTEKEDEEFSHISDRPVDD